MYVRVVYRVNLYSVIFVVLDFFFIFLSKDFFSAAFFLIVYPSKRNSAAPRFLNCCCHWGLPVLCRVADLTSISILFYIYCYIIISLCCPRHFLHIYIYYTYTCTHLYMGIPIGKSPIYIHICTVWYMYVFSVQLRKLAFRFYLTHSIFPFCTCATIFLHFCRYMCFLSSGFSLFCIALF